MPAIQQALTELLELGQGLFTTQPAPHQPATGHDILDPAHPRTVQVNHLPGGPGGIDQVQDFSQARRSRKFPPGDGAGLETTSCPRSRACCSNNEQLI